MIEIKPFDFAKDWSHYCGLHHRARGRSVDQVYVNWKFLENPAGQGFGYGAWDNDRLVGLAGMEPRKFWIQGKEETTGPGEGALVGQQYWFGNVRNLSAGRDQQGTFDYLVKRKRRKHDATGDLPILDRVL